VVSNFNGTVTGGNGDGTFPMESSDAVTLHQLGKDITKSASKVAAIEK